jgi:hypothetical protein
MGPKNTRKDSRWGLVWDLVDLGALLFGGEVVGAGRHISTYVVLFVGAGLGLVVLIAVMVLAGLVVFIFGLDHGPYLWLGSVVLSLGFFGGLVAAGIVLLRLVRRNRGFVAFTSFAEEPQPADEGQPPVIAAAAAPRAATSPEMLRALDARLSPGGDSASDDPNEP